MTDHGVASSTPAHSNASTLSGMGDTGRRQPVVFWGLFGLLLIALVAWAISAMWSLPLTSVLRDFSCDDSFYFSEIARRLATSGQSSFDGVAATNGYQPLWLWLEVPVFWLGLDREDALRATRSLEVLLGLAGFLLLAFAARRAGVRPWLLPLLLLLFVGTVELYIGMEAGTNIAALALAIAVTVCAAERGGRWWSASLGLVLALGVMARLDNLAFAAVVVACFVTPGFGLLRTRAPKTILLLALLVPVGAYLAWNQAVFDSPVPVSGLVKQLWSESTPDAGWPRFCRRFAQLWSHNPVRDGVIFGVLGAIAVIPTLRRQGSTPARRAFAVALLGLLGLALAKLVFYAATVEPAFANYGWYFVTGKLCRFVCILWIAEGLLRLLWPRSRDARWLGVPVLAVVAVLCWGELAEYSQRAARPEPDWEILSWEGARWLDANVTDGDRIGSFDAGVLGYFSRHAVTNLDGLVQSRAFLERRRQGIPLVDDLDALGISVLANVIVDPAHFYREKGFAGAAEHGWHEVYRDPRRALVEGEWRSFAVLRRR